MSTVACRILLALALALSIAAPASAQDAPQPAEDRPTTLVNFYGHVFNFGLGAPMPTNTQFPYGEDNLGLGSFDWCTDNVWVDNTGDVPAVATDKGCDRDANNKLVLFSTAGPVDIGTRDEFFGGGGYVQFHNERGSTRNIVLDKSKPVTATLFMSLDIHAWSVGQTVGDPVFPATTTYCAYPNPPDTGCLYPYWGWDPAAWPAWTVKATLYYSVFGEYGSGASDQIPIAEALEGGQATVVAEGATQPMDVQNGLPGAPNVHRFDISLGNPKVEVIPKEANFFLVYDFYSTTPAGKAAAHTWRIWTGEFFPPMFTLPTKSAFDVEMVVPVFLHGKLIVFGVLDTPWGSYDVDPKATKLVITDSNGKEIEPKSLEVVSEYKFAHGAHYNPVNVSYIWNYQQDGLAPGVYTAMISGANQQGNAAAQCQATFEIRPNGASGNVQIGRCGDPEAAVDGEAPAPSAGAGSRDREMSLDLPYDLGDDVGVAATAVTPIPVLATPLAALALAFALAFGRRLLP